MSEHRPATINVSALPDFAFSHRGLMWWGTLGIMLVEGAMFVALLASYFYLRARAAVWPLDAQAPDPFYGTHAAGSAR